MKNIFGIHLSQVIIYDSYARSDYQGNSDVDVSMYRINNDFDTLDTAKLCMDILRRSGRIVWSSQVNCKESSKFFEGERNTEVIIRKMFVFKNNFGHIW